MNHSFTPSIADATKCGVCKLSEIDHTDNATCDACPNIGPVNIYYGNMKMCDSCREKEQKLDTENNTPEKQATRLAEYQIRMAKEQDNRIKVSTDLFNAETVSLIDIKKAIWSDSTIENKEFKYAEIITERYNNFADKIFSARKEIEENTNKQRAIQVELNQITNQLRKEEREKLRLKDINYNPETVKPIKSKDITVRPSVKKVSLTEVRKAASEHNLPEFALHMLINQGKSITEAVLTLKRAIDSAKKVS